MVAPDDPHPPWAYIASVLFHDWYWYPMHRKNADTIASSVWGRLFQNWEKVALNPDDLSVKGWKEVGTEPLQMHKETLKLMGKAIRILGECIKEAPEFKKKMGKRKSRERMDNEFFPAQVGEPLRRFPLA